MFHVLLDIKQKIVVIIGVNCFDVYSGDTNNPITKWSHCKNCQLKG